MLAIISQAATRATRAVLPKLAEGATYVTSPFAAFTTVATLAGGPATLTGRLAGYAAAGVFMHFGGPEALSREARQLTAGLCQHWANCEQKALLARKARVQEYIAIAQSSRMP